jgi:hypothetical protein
MVDIGTLLHLASLELISYEAVSVGGSVLLRPGDVVLARRRGSSRWATIVCDGFLSLKLTYTGQTEFDAGELQYQIQWASNRHSEQMVVLTSELLHAGANGDSQSGFCYAQLEVLGISTPPPKGWLKGLVGKAIPRSQYDRFLSFRKKR